MSKAEKYETIMDRANELYAVAKLGENAYYLAPELRPMIQSDQVKSLLKAILELL